MEILAVLAVLQLLLLISAGSMLRSYFVRGRHRGMQEAATEIIRGVNSHFDVVEGQLPPSVSKALEILNAAPGNASHRKQLDHRRAQLWIFGDAVGSACRSKGYRPGKQTMGPREGRMFIELSLDELLELNWLAHLGFQHMMPNYRGFEIHRFSGEEDAWEGAKAVAKIEAVIPAKERPFSDLSVQVQGRQKLIRDWWQAVPSKLTA